MKPRFRDRISALLGQGFGSEDIAIRLKCAPELVRREITRLREEGRLRDIVRPKKETPQE